MTKPDPGTLAVLPAFLAVALGYLLGSLMFAIILSRALHGVDIRRTGSGNPGFTNVFRELGTRTGVWTLVADIAKGLVAVAGARWGLARLFAQDPMLLGLAAALGALAGHSWPVFFGFRGGKGVATMAGAFLGLAPGAVGIAVGVWALALFAFRFMSVASMAGALALAVALTWLPGGGQAHAVLALTGWVVAAAIVLRHRSNVSKLRRGQERRFSFRRS